MDFVLHPVAGTALAELTTDSAAIRSAADGADLVGNLYFQGFDGVIVQADQLAPAFFDLKTRLAGEILQKFSTYRIRLAIVGDFSAPASASLRDFIFESNQQRLVNFVGSRAEALAVLAPAQ